MDVLNRIINQDYDVKLSDTDVVNIVEYYNMLVSMPPQNNPSNPNGLFIDRCHYIKTIIESLNNGIIEADTFLTVAITNCTDQEGLLLIALACRFGANPNLYVVVNEVGVMHIMAYVVMYQRGKISNTLIKYILCLLTILGASGASPVSGDEYQSQYEDVTVSDWLYSQGYPPFADTQEYIKQLTLEEQIYLGTIADLPDFAYPIGYSENDIVTEEIDENGFYQEERQSMVPGPDLEQVLLYNAYKCAKYASISKTTSKGEIAELKITVETWSLEVFKILIDRGFNFSYFSMNRLLVLLANTVTNVTYKIPNLIYLQMLKYVISKGVQIDREQFTFLNNFSSSYAEEIKRVNEHPLWAKTCSSSEVVPLPEMVKALAISLNIDASAPKKEVCMNLRNLNKKSSTTESEDNIKRAAIKRQKNRATGELFGASDYTSGTPDVYCKNMSNFENNPFDYGDASLAYYKDKNKNVWCFVASDYENILTNPVNPVTKEPLPAYFIQKIQKSMDIFKTAGVSVRKVVPYGDALKNLKKNDTITNNSTMDAIETVLRLAQTRGIYGEILRNTTTEKMNYTLSVINMDQDYLPMLQTQSHKFATFCKAMYIYFKKNPESITEVFNYL